MKGASSIKLRFAIYWSEIDLRSELPWAVGTRLAVRILETSLKSTKSSGAVTLSRKKEGHYTHFFCQHKNQ
jgi:hypothetical protein